MCMRARAEPVEGGDATLAPRCAGTDQSADLKGWDHRAMVQIRAFPVTRGLREVPQSVVARVPARISVSARALRGRSAGMAEGRIARTSSCSNRRYLAAT